MLIIPYICPSFSPIAIYISDLSGPMRARVFKFVYTYRGLVLLCKRKARYYDLFCLLFPFCPFSICHSNVRHSKICVKDSSGTRKPRILKVCTNIGFDLYFVRENQHPPAYHSLYLPIFLFFLIKFLHKFLTCY